MENQRMKKLLNDATQHVARNDKPKIVSVVWKGPSCSTGRDNYFVQPIAGESHQGYHAGMRVFEPGKPMKEDYGPPVHTKGEAVMAAQSAAAEWLAAREQDRKRAAVLRPDAPRNPAEEQRMLKALHEEREQAQRYEAPSRGR